MSDKVQVEKVAIPAGSRVGQIFSRVDYGDAYRVKVPNDLDLETVTRLLLTTNPEWAIKLLQLRNLLVKPFNLKTGKIRPMLKSQNVSFEPGTRVGIFRVFERTSTEILMGDDDRHLDYRTSCLLQPEKDFAWATFSTVVHYNNWLGRVYFLPVKPFHRLIVASMLKQGAQRLQTEREKLSVTK
jgi:hypothetical protein